MSTTLSIFALIHGGILLFLTFRLIPAGPDRLLRYRECLASLMQDGGLRSVACWIHYILLHTFPLVFGLAFLLRSDINFLPVLLTILISMQFLQRIYPGITRIETAGGEDSSEYDYDEDLRES